jgi:hypothetical protein
MDWITVLLTELFEHCIFVIVVLDKRDSVIEE